MQQFAELVQILATSTKTNDKLEAIQGYFEKANEKDKTWVIALFTGRRPRRSVNSTLLAGWCMELANIPGWLFEESYHTVGDLAETIALLLPEPDPALHKTEYPLFHYMEALMQMEKQDEGVKKKFVTE